MTISSGDIIEMAVSHAAASGWFDQVNAHEPKNKPGYGLTAAVWVQSLGPIAARSGLATTSALLVLNIRLYTNMTQEPQDAIDPNLVSAADALMDAYSGDFTLDGLVAEVDLLGRYGPSLAGDAGYINQDGTLFRVITITLPCVINDAWTQAP